MSGRGTYEGAQAKTTYWNTKELYVIKIGKKIVICSHSLKNVKIGSFTSKSCNDGKEMYKNACCICKVVVLLI